MNLRIINLVKEPTTTTIASIKVTVASKKSSTPKTNLQTDIIYKYNAVPISVITSEHKCPRGQLFVDGECRENIEIPNSY